MFIKEDYIDYFGQLLNVERIMLYRVQDDLTQIEDPHMRTFLQEVLEDECKHYSYVKDILDNIFLRTEKRTCLGIRSLGKVQFKDSLGSAESFPGFYFHSTPNDIYIECTGPIPALTKVEVSMENSKKPRVGRVVWSCNPTPHVSLLKVQF